MPLAWENIRRLLAVRLDNIGDVVMLGPALRTLKRSLPHSHLTLMVTKAGNKVTPMLPWVDDVILHRPIWQEISPDLEFDPKQDLGMAGMLRSRDFDAAVIFTSFSQSPYPPAYLCYLAGIPVRLGQSKEFGGRVLTHWIKSPPDDLHQVDRNLHLLESAGLETGGRSLELQVPEADQEAAEALLQGYGLAAGERFIALAPGASCAARQYDATRFAQVASLLKKETGLPQVVVGSERETSAAKRISDARNGRPAVALGTSVGVMAGILRRAGLLIGNNSGPMHIADAVGTPMVILYSGAELREQWRPRSAPAVLLTRPAACSPCHRMQCPYSMECLDIPPEKVVEQALAILGKQVSTVTAPATVLVRACRQAAWIGRAFESPAQ
jgi:ADP-heptose:LPS heptosyltransferase